MLEKLMDKVVPVAGKLSNNRYLVSLRDGFMLAFPATIFASIVMIISNLPQTFKFDQFLSQGILDFISDFFGPVTNATIGITAIFVAFGVAYHLAKNYKATALYSGAVSVSAFLLLMPMKIEEDSVYIPLGKLGAQGMFLAIITAMIVAEVFSRIELADITIKMPEQVPPGIAKSFIAVLPGAATLFIFVIIRYLFTFTSDGNAFDFIYHVLQKPLLNLGASLPATLAAVFLAQILWWFGIHGQSIVNSVMEPIWSTLAIENMNALQAGQDLPHIINTTFMGVFPLNGGNGMTVGAVILAMIIARSVRMKKISKMVAVPTCFNISEPVTFGLPIVLNPMVLIPWIVAPMVVVTISYFAIAIGLVPKPTGATIVWTTPVFLSGWLGTGSIRGALLQVVNIIAATLIWTPFIMALDRAYLKEESESEEKNKVEV